MAPPDSQQLRRVPGRQRWSIALVDTPVVPRLCRRTPSSPAGQSIGAVMRGRRFLPIPLPAALGSNGITRLHRYYGGSDSCRVSVAGGLARQVSCVHVTSLPGHTATNHTDSLTPRLRLSRDAIMASPFARRLAALSTPNRVHFRCGLSGSVRCSPPRLAATQLLSVRSRERIPAGRGLPHRRDVTLHRARTRRFPAFRAFGHPTTLESDP